MLRPEQKNPHSVFGILCTVSKQEEDFIMGRKDRIRLNSKGFSLVELIIVIAIMAVLAGTIASALIKYLEKSRKTTDMSNATEIEKF